MQSFFKGIA
jgi:elongation factor G